MRIIVYFTSYISDFLPASTKSDLGSWCHVCSTVDIKPRSLAEDIHLYKHLYNISIRVYNIGMHFIFYLYTIERHLHILLKHLYSIKIRLYTLG